MSKEVSVVVTAMNCERIVGVFCDEAKKLIDAYKGEEFPDSTHNDLMEMLAKTVVAYSMFLGIKQESLFAALDEIREESKGFIKILADVPNLHSMPKEMQ